MLSVQSNKNINEETACLYLVPTPIGNLEDMTFRAVRILKEVDLILAEDTRNSGHLLKHFDITTPMQSFHEFSTEEQVDRYIQMLVDGKRLALISDAGMPLINDPGHPLVTRMITEQLPIIALPGANAALTALIASGLASDQFFYLGFFPRKKQEQEQILDWLGRQRGTAIFYESPHRIKKTVERLSKVLPVETKLVIARELTKKFEEFLRGNIVEIQTYLSEFTLKGEIVLMIEAGTLVNYGSQNIDIENLKQVVEDWIEVQRVSPIKAIKEVAKQYQLKKQDVYDAYHELK